MRISDLLRVKGAGVATADPGTTVGELVDELNRQNIGAVVVLDDDRIVGVASERDVVRKLHGCGEQLLNAPLSAIMTTEIVSCAPDDNVERIAEIMTERRVRHMPVLVDGRLGGIVSIGDVVKSRISELESDREQLESYISGGGR